MTTACLVSVALLTDAINMIVLTGYHSAVRYRPPWLPVFTGLVSVALRESMYKKRQSIPERRVSFSEGYQPQRFMAVI